MYLFFMIKIVVMNIASEIKSRIKKLYPDKQEVIRFLLQKSTLKSSGICRKEDVVISGILFFIIITKSSTGFLKISKIETLKFVFLVAWLPNCQMIENISSNKIDKKMGICILIVFLSIFLLYKIIS